MKKFHIFLLIPATREARAAELRELEQTLANIETGCKDPIFKAYYEAIADAVESMTARRDALLLIANLEQLLGDSVQMVEVLTQRLADHHARHAKVECAGAGCPVCDDIGLACDLAARDVDACLASVLLHPTPQEGAGHVRS